MYKVINNGIVFDKIENLFIPINNNSPSCEKYLAWVAEGNTPEPADPPPAPDYSAMRKAAYAAESDPIFFMSQRGEATQQQWLDKVAEIKARWPQ